MADDRPVDDPVAQLGKLTRQVDEVRSLVLARLGQRATGTVEISLLPTAKAGTLLLAGQAVNRADYPGLWQWAQDNGRVTAGLFTTGNGTTTFTVPNFSGRYLIATGTGDIADVGDLVGANSRTLTMSQMPAHNHGNAGAHGPHPEFGIPVGAGGPPPTAFSGDALTLGDHTHDTEGGGLPFDNRPASIAVSFLIWT